MNTIEGIKLLQCVRNHVKHQLIICHSYDANSQAIGAPASLWGMLTQIFCFTGEWRDPSVLSPSVIARDHLGAERSQTTTLLQETKEDKTSQTALQNILGGIINWHGMCKVRCLRRAQRILDNNTHPSISLWLSSIHPHPLRFLVPPNHYLLHSAHSHYNKVFPTCTTI